MYVYKDVAVQYGVPHFLHTSSIEKEMAEEQNEIKTKDTAEDA